jgi:hypothetical protein
MLESKSVYIGSWTQPREPVRNEQNNQLDPEKGCFCWSWKRQGRHGRVIVAENV